MNSTKRIALAVVLLVVVTVSFFVGFRSGKDSAYGSANVPGLANTMQGQASTTDFSAFWKAWNLINEKYAGTSTPDAERVYGAIAGMTASLGDPYTIFFPPEEAEIFESEIAGNFEGVGMEVGIRDGRLAVVAPIKDSPAEKAGVKAGDFIVKINDTDSATMSTDQAVKLIRGKAGTQVTLTLSRDGAAAPVVITITRAKIDLPTISTGQDGRMTSEGEPANGLRSDGIYVISLYSFSANSANLFRNALQEFSDSGSNRLVLDLRGNPGGYLDAAVDMASWFLPKGKVIVKEEFSRGEPEKELRSKGYDAFEGAGLEMVILVDGGSASASEILAGSLSEHGIATLVGTKTFGKGSVQELIPITDDTSLKVTVAKWLTPNGHSISEQGITPDHVVTVSAEDIAAKRDPQMAKAVELLVGGR